MVIGVLALQGAFIEHENMLHTLGVSCIELRNAEDLKKKYDGIILPGGESTVQRKLLYGLGMHSTLQQQIQNGIPVLATCAGMILLASQIEQQDTPCFATIPMTVRRNAYGRQLGSFHTVSTVKHVGTVPMTFIRAPYVTKAEPSVELLASVDDKIVGVQYGRQLAFAFHPELDESTRIHQYFMKLIEERQSQQPV
ncbi:MAG: pyridoxal 5'-phosphate synthase glutaminase subunit PdxT [Lachnospiraceae bacterium]|nr:pyridoxal 5'-phosphate synthase glutaminase subunit PdxT [Lachnospiraceae bacterium]